MFPIAGAAGNCGEWRDTESRQGAETLSTQSNEAPTFNRGKPFLGGGPLGGSRVYVTRRGTNPDARRDARSMLSASAPFCFGLNSARAWSTRCTPLREGELDYHPTYISVSICGGFTDTFGSPTMGSEKSKNNSGSDEGFINLWFGSSLIITPPISTRRLRVLRTNRAGEPVVDLFRSETASSF